MEGTSCVRGSLSRNHRNQVASALKLCPASSKCAARILVLRISVQTHPPLSGAAWRCSTRLRSTNHRSLPQIDALQAARRVRKPARAARRLDAPTTHAARHRRPRIGRLLASPDATTQRSPTFERRLKPRANSSWLPRKLPRILWDPLIHGTCARLTQPFATKRDFLPRCRRLIRDHELTASRRPRNIPARVRDEPDLSAPDSQEVSEALLASGGQEAGHVDELDLRLGYAHLLHDGS
jgi:hypothetical protein